MQKSPGDSTADLPASAFELKTMALKQTLLIDFNGVTLAPSARQSFNENFDSSIVEPRPRRRYSEATATAAPAERGRNRCRSAHHGCRGSRGRSAHHVRFAQTRPVRKPRSATRVRQLRDHVECQPFNCWGGVAYDNFANKVYGPMEDDVYDNIAQPAMSDA
ncbi:hypothetical protein BOX15_Mlig012180g4 [Macrostomum lignano]|uniref:Uncharacterized protein n=1 Tax=Macrostomum lignano TaxID=282301 RepID=A0A267ERA6_9PLAT|nr:hypothetical protein BOX15_Mlig012180g4 [Macrostomum lignano]